MRAQAGAVLHVVPSGRPQVELRGDRGALAVLPPRRLGTYYYSTTTSTTTNVRCALGCTWHVPTSASACRLPAIGFTLAHSWRQRRVQSPVRCSCASACAALFYFHTNTEHRQCDSEQTRSQFRVQCSEASAGSSSERHQSQAGRATRESEVQLICESPSGTSSAASSARPLSLDSLRALLE